MLALETIRQAPTVLLRDHLDGSEDLAADCVMYAEVRYTPEPSTEPGLTLDEVSGLMNAGEGRPLPP